MSKTTGTKPDIPILFEDPHILVINKPINILSQKDRTGDSDVHTLCKAYLSQKSGVKNTPYLGLLHRLDRPVGGVMVFAKTRNAAADLSEQIRKRLFLKQYLVVVSGNTPPNGVLLNFLSKDPESNRVIVSEGGGRADKKAELSYLKKAYDSERDLTLLQVQLITGRTHQIRVQFSHAGYPLPGDSKYGIQTAFSITPALLSHKISFSHPVTGEKVNFKTDPPDLQPWSFFLNR